MAIVSMILGESGTGKSASMRNFTPQEVLLIQAIAKPLPFRNGWQNVISPDGTPNPEGCIYHSDQAANIINAMQRTRKDVIVIDDFQYIMANEFMRSVTNDNKGNEAFQRFNRIARNAWDILNEAANLPQHKRVYLLSHTQTDDNGKTRIKTIGRLLDEKITLEGMVTIVLRSQAINGNYVFQTHNSGSDTVKSPMDMFSEDHIPNDLKAVDNTICNFYQPVNKEENHV